LTPIVLGVCVSVGAKVTLLEKEAKVGGNSAKATSGINGWGTMPQAVEQIHDEERNFERDTFRSGKGGTALACASLTCSCRTAQVPSFSLGSTAVDVYPLIPTRE
jgi:succinate dehydrogenase/fumarate reductase flavoprotein subunit